MPDTQTRGALPIGFLPSGPANGSVGLSLNAANTWLAYGFVPSEAKTLSKVKAFISTVTGTLTAAGLSCTLYSDTAATGPNAVIEARTSYTTDPPTSSTWIEFTGFTTALTAGTQYWLVFRNNVGTPASNFPTYRYIDSGAYSYPTNGSNVAYGWHKRHSTDGGSTWAAGNAAAIAGMRVEYSDGSFDGSPISQTVGTTAASAVRANQEVGVVFTTPANASLNVRGITFFLMKTGTPTGNLRYRIYSGSAGSATLITNGTTANIPAGNAANNAYVTLYFANQIQLAANTQYRATMSETTQSDTSSNCFQTREYVIENDANSRALMPFDGTMFKTSTSDASGGTVVFTDDNTTTMPFALLPDTTGEFASSGGSTTLSAARTMGGM